MSFNSNARIVGFVGMLVSAMATHAWAKGEWLQNWEMETASRSRSSFWWRG